MTSENGGFDGTLSGVVTCISLQVRQRAVLSTDPVEDADARVVAVRVRLEPQDAERVSAFAGLKVIARFQP
jgi:HlyD family secretion protein